MMLRHTVFCGKKKKYRIFCPICNKKQEAHRDTFHKLTQQKASAKKLNVYSQQKKQCDPFQILAINLRNVALSVDGSYFLCVSVKRPRPWVYWCCWMEVHQIINSETRNFSWYVKICTPYANSNLKESAVKEKRTHQQDDKGIVSFSHKFMWVDARLFVNGISECLPHSLSLSMRIVDNCG